MRTFGIGSASLINGNRYILLNRCKYNIEKSKLCDIEYEDEKGAFKFNGSQYTICNNYEPIIVSDKKREFINNDAEGTKTDSLTREKYVLGEIISTMTQEQDNALRLPENGITIIEGVAGSGKTNIGFHRLVYLINEFPKKFSQKNIAVFCYNLALKKYLENLAKELFLNDIKIFSIDE
ncbi:MAG: UvrD-helicase domain-containing protein [Candidatus Paceibacterota bacterium]|jgi:superfamily I DNA and RNA helicase